MHKLGNIEVFESSCNITTVQDGRGAIFTWLPKEPIVETPNDAIRCFYETGLDFLVINNFLISKF